MFFQTLLGLDDNIEQIYILRVANIGQVSVKVRKFILLNDKNKKEGMFANLIDAHSPDILSGEHYDFPIPMDNLLASILDEKIFNSKKELCFEIIDNFDNRYKIFGNKPDDFKKVISLDEFNDMMKERDLLK